MGAAMPSWMLYLSAFVAALVVLPWDISVQPGPIPWENKATENSGPLDTPDYTREVLYFPCSGVSCEAWLYMPKNPGSTPPPVVLMAHGFGGQKDMGLHRYAESFSGGGLAALVFDYRTFGGSEGEPRLWVSPARHVADWHAAIAFVRSPDGLAQRVDSSNMCLWGTSFAGGHVLVVAEQTPNITAIISQVPHLDGIRASRISIEKRGIPQTLRMVVAGLHDAMRTSLGQAAAYLPLVGAPGSMAFMQLDPFEQTEYFAKHPKVYQGGWRNMARARLVLELSRYSPIKAVPNITAPILFVAATDDSLCAFDAVERAVASAQRATLLARNCTHFELYRGNMFDSVIDTEVEFLRSHALPGADAPGADASEGAGGEGDVEE